MKLREKVYFFAPPAPYPILLGVIILKLSIFPVKKQLSFRCSKRHFSGARKSTLFRALGLINCVHRAVGCSHVFQPGSHG